MNLPVPIKSQKAVEVARAELLSPSLFLTQQYLSAFGVRTEKGLPIAAHVDQQEQWSTVYFPVENGNFYLVVDLEVGPQPQVKAVRTEVGGYLYLFIQKSQAVTKPPLPLVPDVVAEDGFVYKFQDDAPAPFRARVARFLDWLAPYKQTLAQVGEQASVSLCMAYCGYKDQMGSLRLGKETLLQLAEMGIELEVDLYAEGNTLVSASWGQEAVGERVLQQGSLFAWTSN